MLTRRDYLALTAKVGAALALPQTLFAQAGSVITRPIPKTGEQLPIVGLGSSATFSEVAGAADTEATMVRVHRDARATAARCSIRRPVTARRRRWPRKPSTSSASRDSCSGRRSSTSRAAARAPIRRAREEQVETSFRRIGRDKIDLIQVHNVADHGDAVPDPRGIQAGRPRALHRHDVDVQAAVRDDRAIHARRVARTSSASIMPSTISTPRSAIFPLAQERGIGGARVFAVRPHAPVGSRRGARGAGVGRRVRRDDLGAVLLEVRRVASGRDGRDACDQQASPHGRQPDGRARPFAGSGRAAAHDRLHRCAALVGSDAPFRGVVQTEREHHAGRHEQ